MTRTVRKAPERPTRDHVVISMRGPWSSPDSIVAVGRRGTAWELEGSVGSAENGKQGGQPSQTRGRRSRKHAMGRVLYAPSWTTWPGQWMHVSPTVLNCTNLTLDASAQSRAENSVTQEIAGVCCESRVGVELRQPLGSRTGLGVRGERRGPAPAAPNPPHFCSPCRVQGCSGCR